MKNKRKEELYVHETDENRECGAVIIEATLSLSFFIFLMFTLLSLINVAYAQARINVAIDSAAKEMSQYAHLYYATEMDEVFTGSGGKSSELINNVSELINQLGTDAGNLNSELGQNITDAGTALSGDNLGDYIKNTSGGVMGKAFMKKNLTNGNGDSADEYLRRLNVVNGLDGIDFGQTSFLESTSGNVNLIASYQIKVLEFFDIDVIFDFAHFAYTKAWGSN